MKSALKNRIIKEIHVDVNKCTGCRACEMACSAFHSTPKYSNLNPAKARIRVLVDEVSDSYIPIRAGEYTPAECAGRNTYTMNGKEYNECAFCRASCPSREYFKDPDSGLPLRCDMCEADPPLEKPLCVQVCKNDALVYIEKEVDGEEVVASDELTIGLETLADKFGLQKIMDSVARMSKND